MSANSILFAFFEMYIFDQVIVPVKNRPRGKLRNITT